MITAEDVVTEKFTSSDLALMPDDGKRREIIEGELYVSRPTGFEHQYTCTRLSRFLDEWNDQSGLGVVVAAPGLVFAEDDDVIPDVIWISLERFERGRDKAGHFIIAPELVIEVLSPGKTNKDRDRQAKLKLYSRRGVQEYWIVDWMMRQVEIYRRERGRLKQIETLLFEDSIESPLLPGFSRPVKSLFFLLP
ncbi:MAG: Uma2 family endonuclease [Acidobacteria bacterium]|nr:Uma2 family endonuclease [Acidobacteriota bacterium]